MGQSKIFGIGLSKTGTTSLADALGLLGYSVIDFPLGLRGVEEHDAATDTPIADCFELLDRQYPRSKFIYTVRQRDRWIRSCKTHWARFVDGGCETRPEAAELFKHLYGTIDFDADLFKKAYDRHETRVLRYFSSRPDDLLIIDICSEESGWEPLCSFLGKEIPDCAFPHMNKKISRVQYYLNKHETLAKIVHNRTWRKTIKKTKKTIRIITDRQWMG